MTRVYGTPCEHCGMGFDVRPTRVRVLRRPNGPVQTVHWCGRCRSTPGRLAALHARWRSRGLRMPRRACIHREPDGRGCPSYARPGSSRCVEHAREQMRNRERSPSSAVSQTHRWRQVRQAVVAERQRPDGTWWCEIGGHVITDRTRIDVDHRQPVAAGGAPYDPDNLRIELLDAQPPCRRQAPRRAEAPGHRGGASTSSR